MRGTGFDAQAPEFIGAFRTEKFVQINIHIEAQQRCGADVVAARVRAHRYAHCFACLGAVEVGEFQVGVACCGARSLCRQLDMLAAAESEIFEVVALDVVERRPLATLGLGPRIPLVKNIRKFPGLSGPKKVNHQIHAAEWVKAIRSSIQWYSLSAEKYPGRFA